MLEPLLHSPVRARRYAAAVGGLLTALATGIAVLLLAPAPAHAEAVSVRDARGDVASSNDIVRTRVVNGRLIAVRIHHRNLRRSALDIQFAVRAPRERPFTVYATLDGKNTIVFDQALQPRDCTGVRVARSLREDWTYLSVPRRCVGSPSGPVQVRPRVQWNKSGSSGDWSVNGNEHWTRWVAR